MSNNPVQPARGANIVVVNNNDPMTSPPPPPPPPPQPPSSSSGADDEMNRQKAAVAADAINQLHPVPVGADVDNDESSITTREPTAASRNVADAAGARLEATHIAQATDNSLRDAVGAFRVDPVSSSSRVGVVADDETAGSAQTNLASMATEGSAGSAQTSIYTNANLPPNIDIIAEATLVESSERPGEYDEENPGEADSAVCEHRPASDTDNPSATNSQGGGNDPSGSSNWGDDNPTDPTPLAAVVAEPMDRFTIYLCGRHARFQIWHLVLIAAIAVALCVAVPVAVTSTNKSKEEEEVQEQSFVWTEQGNFTFITQYDKSDHRYRVTTGLGGSWKQFHQDFLSRTIGHYDGFDSTTNIASFSDGDWCEEVGKPRSGKVKFIEDSSMTDDYVVTRMFEGPVCEYEIDIKVLACGPCTSAPKATVPGGEADPCALCEGMVPCYTDACVLRNVVSGTWTGVAEPCNAGAALCELCFANSACFGFGSGGDGGDGAVALTGTGNDERDASDDVDQD